MPEDIILQELKTKFCQASEAIPYFTVKYRIFLPFLCPQSDVGSVVGCHSESGESCHFEFELSLFPLSACHSVSSSKRL